MTNYSKDPMDRIADAVEKLAGGSSPDEPTTTGVEIYGGRVGMYNAPFNISYLLKFEGLVNPDNPEYSDFVVPVIVPGSENTSDMYELQNVAFFKKVDDTTGDVSYVTFFFSKQPNPIVNVYGDIAIEANVLYDYTVYLEVSKIPEGDEVTLQIMSQLG